MGVYVYPKLAQARKIAREKYGVTARDLVSSNKYPYKLDVTLEKNGHFVTIHFGDRRYEDFLIHKDPERRRRYRIRHQNDNINDIYSRGFWSWHVLW